MAKKEKQKMVWIKSNKKKDGELYAINMLDTNYIMPDGDILRIGITTEMARKEIPIEVPETGVVKQFIKDGFLEVVESGEAKKKYDKFAKAKKVKENAIEKEKLEESENEHEAIEAAKAAYAEVKERRNRNVI